MASIDQVGKASQLKFVRVAQMLLFSNALCDPPLGQATVIPVDQHAVQFTVLLESSKSFPEQNWEAVLWHDGHEDQSWNELIFTQHESPDQPLVVESGSRPQAYRRWFSISLPKPSRPGPLYFTFKFRLSSDNTWKWANEHCQTTDGVLYFQPQISPPRLENYLQNYSRDFSVNQVESETPNTQLWSLTSSVEAAEGKLSGITDTSLGIPRSFSRWFSLVRIWSPWLAPRHGERQFSPTEPAVVSSFLRMDGLHLVLLAVSGVDDVLTAFRPDGHGNVIVHSKNDSTEEGQARVLAAVGTTFNTALAAVMYQARKIVMGLDTMSESNKKEMQRALEKDVKAEYMYNWYDGLTYCTWNALGQNLDEQKIFNALNVLKDKGIEVTNFIIDDNWQSLDHQGESQLQRGWTDFDANKDGFPSGLKHTATMIREQHPNIQHIAVWHALLGYWGGVSPTGNLAKNYKTRTVRKAEGLVGGEMTVIHEDDVPRMYDDFYKFLLDSGIDSVKTDAQFFLDVMDDADDRRRFMKTYQDAWTISSLRYFSLKVISCMSQIPQILFHTQLATDKPRLMVRNSDDFFPDVPSSHPFHIFANAHTSLLTSHLNVLPDWDMFQTSHPYSSYHAAARAISGGPIYITDTPGEHSLPLIASMTATTISPNPPKTIILRPNNIAKCIEQSVYTPYQARHFLQIGNYHSGSTASYGASLLGVFNVSEQALTELIPLAHFPGVKPGEGYLVRAHPSGDISSPLSLDAFDPVPSVLNVALGLKGWNILTAYPILSATPPASTSTSSAEKEKKEEKKKTTELAVLGLLHKLSGAAAVVGTPKVDHLNPTGSANVKITITLKALGVLGVWVSSLPEPEQDPEPQSDVPKAPPQPPQPPPPQQQTPPEWQNHILVLLRGHVVPVSTVSASFVGGKKAGKGGSVLIEIDVERAWREMGLVAGWGREVEIEVIVS